MSHELATFTGWAATAPGAPLERHSYDPGPLGAEEVAMRVHERGVGETRSCGTGVVASAAAYRAASDHEGPVRVTVPGGELTVDFDGDNARLTGPAVIVGRGEFWI